MTRCLLELELILRDRDPNCEAGTVTGREKSSLGSFHEILSREIWLSLFLQICHCNLLTGLASQGLVLEAIQPTLLFPQFDSSVPLNTIFRRYCAESSREQLG